MCLLKAVIMSESVSRHIRSSDQ